MIQLYRGDCLEEIKKIPDKSVDLVLTDPPYGIDFQSSWRTEKEKRHKKIANDKKPFIDFIKEIPRVIKETGAVIVFSRWDVQQKFMDEMERCDMKPKGVLIWHKGGGGMGDLKKSWATDYETAIFWAGEKFEFQRGRPGSSVIKSAKVPPEKLTHPNEKPVDLLRFIIGETCPRGGYGAGLLYGKWIDRRSSKEKRAGFYRNRAGREILRNGKEKDKWATRAA